MLGRRRPELTPNERRQLERALVASMADCETVPSIDDVARAVGVRPATLRRSIGSIAAARRTMVLDTLTIARSCADLRRTWHLTLRPFATRLVVHRTYIHRIVAPVLPCIERCPDAVEAYERLQLDLRTEVAHQIERWDDLLADFSAERLVDELEVVLDLRRVDQLAADDPAVAERELVADVLAVFGGFGVVDQWKSLRHRWAPGAPPDPRTVRGGPVAHVPPPPPITGVAADALGR